MATFMGDICHIGGKYQDRETGEEKLIWVKKGQLFQNDKGFRIRIYDPAHEDGHYWLNVFPPREDNRRNSPPAAPSNPAPQQQKKGAGFDDDDIPF